MRVTVALALLLLAGRPQPALEVTQRDGRIVVRAVAAPLAEVLARFAEVTGTKIVYEAARPRQPVSASIEAASPAEAIARLLEGQGLNYALRLDPAGRNVDLLVITGGTTAVAGASQPAGRPSPAAPVAPAEAEGQDESVGDAGLPFSPDPAGDVQQPEPALTEAPGVAPPGPWMQAPPAVAPGTEPSGHESAGGVPGLEPGQPQPPGAASYPSPAPASPPPSPPVPPRPVSYP